MPTKKYNSIPSAIDGIENAIYGDDMRDAIYDSIYMMNDSFTAVVDKANAAATNAEESANKAIAKYENVSKLDNFGLQFTVNTKEKESKLMKKYNDDDPRGSTVINWKFNIPKGVYLVIGQIYVNSSSEEANNTIGFSYGQGDFDGSDGPDPDQSELDAKADEIMWGFDTSRSGFVNMARQYQPAKATSVLNASTIINIETNGTTFNSNYISLHGWTDATGDKSFRNAFMRIIKIA